jgi:enamine deaminase RidA (YjgF/YER057c/UK114 family)
MDVEKRVAELGLDIPGQLGAGGLYTSVVVEGNLAFTSGVVAVNIGPPLGLAYRGQVGSELSVEEGQASARGAMISTLANLRGVLGSLNRVDRVLKLTGYVRSAPDFFELPKILDGASQVIIDIFGDDLRSARTTVGVFGLPGGASVELDTIVRIST